MLKFCKARLLIGIVFSCGNFGLATDAATQNEIRKEFNLKVDEAAKSHVWVPFKSTALKTQHNEPKRGKLGVNQDIDSESSIDEIANILVENVQSPEQEDKYDSYDCSKLEAPKLNYRLVYGATKRLIKRLKQAIASKQSVENIKIEDINSDINNVLCKGSGNNANLNQCKKDAEIYCNHLNLPQFIKEMILKYHTPKNTQPFKEITKETTLFNAKQNKDNVQASGEKKSGQEIQSKPHGITNIGATCYFATAMQCLYTPLLREGIEALAETNALALIIKDTVFNKLDALNPGEVLSEQDVKIVFEAIREIISSKDSKKITQKNPEGWNFMAPGVQEDASEILTKIFENLTDFSDDEVIKKLKEKLENMEKGPKKNAYYEKEYSPQHSARIKELKGNLPFSGELSFNQSSPSDFDGLYGVDIDAAETKTVQDAVSKEQIAGKFKKTPTTLTVLLKRFEDEGRKNNKIIEFDERLQLTDVAGRLHTYILKAMALHSGATPKGGHWYAVVRGQDDQYYCVNDSYVQPTELSKYQKSSDPSMFIYEEKEQ